MKKETESENGKKKVKIFFNEGKTWQVRNVFGNKC
jgi:hypothetical protein